MAEEPEAKVAAVKEAAVAEAAPEAAPEAPAAEAEAEAPTKACAAADDAPKGTPTPVLSGDHVVVNVEAAA